MGCLPRSFSSLHRRMSGVLVLLLTAGLMVGVVAEAQAIRVVTWNVLRYSGGGDSRNADYQTVLADLQADILILQEIEGFGGRDDFFDDVLEVIEPGAWTKAPFSNGFDTDNACYFRDSLVDYAGQVVLNTALRNINGYIFRLENYGAAGEFRFYSVHLKAGGSGGDEDLREAEAQVLRGHLNSLPAGTHFATCGDFNWDSASEAAYQVFNGLGVNTAGQQFDPVDADFPGNWSNNPVYAMLHSQSPRATQIGGGASGGLDDRFDMFLVNDDFEDNAGINYLPGSYTVFGQDGQHLNKAITDLPANAAVSAGVAQALHDASDHLPVYIELQLPPILSLVAGNATFGTVIEGAATAGSIVLQNVAVDPADDLDYSLSADPGFVVPAGSFSLDPGVGFGVHSVTLDTATPGDYSGNVSVLNDDPLNPVFNVPASGTVLGHAVPSVEAASAVLSQAVDFGSQEPGNFVDQAIEVHNFGFGSLQAELEVYDAQVTGPDAARFSVVSFAPANVGATPASFDVSFDDAGAATSATYTATLTLSTRDQQDLTGATDLSDLVYELEAFVEDMVVNVGEVPTVTRLHENVPNPFNPRSVIAFELAETVDAQLRVYDSAGRLVRVLASGVRDAGRHEVVFDGRGDRGEVLASGVYYYRLDAGSLTLARKMTLVR